MKKIINWKMATVFDIESDGLLEESTVFHVLSFHMANGKSGSIKGKDHNRFRAFCKYHIDNKIPVVAHRGILFDIALIEKLLDLDLSELMVIDTLAISWYLNTKRKLHGLDSFLEDYGIAKPKVSDGEWVKPIRGITVGMRKEGKIKVLTYKYLVEPEELTDDYKKFGIVVSDIEQSVLDGMESTEDYQSRIKQLLELLILS